MQPSDQHPGEEEEINKEQRAVGGAEPLYEFMAGDALLNTTYTPAPITQVLTESELGQMPLEEAIRQGLVYPPPPSFYQNMQPPATQAPLPGSVQPPPFVQAPVAAKPSRRWVWVVVTVLAVAFLGACGACVWGTAALLRPITQQVSGSLAVVNDYYSNIEAQHYAAAYADLALQGNQLSQAQFIQEAQQQDAQYGPVTSFTIEQVSFNTNPNTGPDLNHLSIPVQVTRNKLSYTTLLTLQKIAGHWKIVDFYKI